jgi:bleomycin hydrolase
MKSIKHFTFILLAMIVAIPTFAGKKDKKDENKQAYVFTTVKDIPTTSVKNQHRSGTCWSFSGLSFLETEIMRKGKGEFNLSEMFVVRQAYSQKAINTVRWHGNLNFGGGGAFHDVTWAFENFGAIPEDAYSGLEYGEEKHVHGELDALTETYIKTVIENKNRKVSTAWHKGFDGILDAYLGEVPETFEVEGVEYTPQSFADYLDLDMSDYVEIGSYTHHPFYSTFILEVPDNWMLDEIYNVPMEDMMSIVENALMNGYSVAWGADVSEKGFSWKNGVAIVPDEDKPEIAGMESEKWEKMDAKEKSKLLYSFDEPVSEKTITQEMRQEQFDNYKTTDDHGMLLTGVAKDQRGVTFYKVKNSWSEKGSPYDGYFYVSKPFVALKTIDIMVHKDAIPQELKDKLGIK